jgi:cytochrome c oxidase subunit 2
MAGVSAGLAVACALLLAGCGKQSIVSPRSPQTHDIRTLWWWMLAVATLVFLGALGMLGLAWIRRGTPGLPFFGERETVPQGLVLIFGIAIPLVILVSLFGVANIYLVQTTAPPPPHQTSLTIQVIGHQWWWEVRYPGSNAVTANEIHIPTNTRVNVLATTADVIHSFWVPQLARKIDEVPGRNNRVLLYASRPGRYRGQCAEFCGFQHANMSLFVVAEARPAYDAWLQNMAAPAPRPTNSSARTGEQLFMANQCASCHMIRGTNARGLIGPDLTHLASRRTLAAAQIRNTSAELRAWIADPQGIKPGARMPNLGLSQTEYDEIAAYLEGLH